MRAGDSEVAGGSGMPDTPFVKIFIVCDGL